jgi:hypothetical protein
MWAAPDARLHPTVWAAKELLRAVPPRLYTDFHGHSRMNETFASGCASAERGAERVFTNTVAMLSEAFTPGSCIFPMPQARRTARRCVIREEMGVAESFCIAAPFCGVSRGRLASMLSDERLWKALGARICKARTVRS